jgi:hypothetical protein
VLDIFRNLFKKERTGRANHFFWRKEVCRWNRKESTVFHICLLRLWLIFLAESSLMSCVFDTHLSVVSIHLKLQSKFLKEKVQITILGVTTSLQSKIPPEEEKNDPNKILRRRSRKTVTSPTTHVGPCYMRECFHSLCGTYCNIPNIQLSYAT